MASKQPAIVGKSEQNKSLYGSVALSLKFNPLVHSVHYIGHLTKILILKGILKNISYERLDYESVDEKILP